MYKKWMIGILSLVMVSGTITFAASVDCRMIAADAKWVAHMDLDTFRTTDMGKLMLAEMDTEEATRQLASLQELFDFSPGDLNDITAYGKSFGGDEGVVIVRGRLNEAKLTAAVSANNVYKKSAYGRHTVHEWTDADSGEPGAGAFHSSGAAVLSKTAKEVQQGLDVLDGKLATLKQDRIGRLPAGAYLVMSCEELDLPVEPGAPGPGQMLEKCDSMRMVLGEASGQLKGEVILTTKSEEDSVTLEQALVGMKALFMLGSAENPEVAQFLNAVQISRVGNSVQLEAGYLAQKCFDAIKTASEKAKTEAAAQQDAE